MRLQIERTAAGRSLVLRRGDGVVHREEPEPLEGTRMDLFNSIIPNWHAENTASGVFWPAGNTLAERVWVANRCIQLNAQQIATMPLQFVGPEDSEPRWVSSPDALWYPNGIADAMHFIVQQIYGWGYSCQYITGFYSDGRPRTWTILDNNFLTIQLRNGSRVYKYGNSIDAEEKDPERIFQIDRNPGARLHGTSALSAFGVQGIGLLAAGNQQNAVSRGAIPPGILKKIQGRTLDKAQATAAQEAWMEASDARAGGPAVLGPDWDFKVLAFNPEEVQLLEGQEFNAKAIMTAFGVPATLMNMSLQGGLTYQNPAALGEMWWRFELRQLATRIANMFTAQLLPAGQYITVDAADTFAPIDPTSEEDDPTAAQSQVAKASPTQVQQARPLTAIGGTG